SPCGGSPQKGGCQTGWVNDLALAGEALGRSRGGLTTKIHLATDGRGLPMSVILTPGQAGDNPQLVPLLRRRPRSVRGRAGSATVRNECSQMERNTAHRPDERCAPGASRSPVQRRPTTPATGYVGAEEAGARTSSTPGSTRAATSSSAASTGSSSSARWPPASPNAPPTTAPHSPAPPSASGSAIPRTRPSESRH